MAGQNVIVNFSFGNAGTAATPAFNIRMQLDGQATTNVPHPAMEPGAQNYVYWNLGGLSRGNHYVYCYVDSNAQVTEQTKQNNVGYHGFGVS